MDIREHAPELSSHPVDIGQRTEAAILSALVRRGYAVLLPFGVNQRYDLVIDLDGRFVRAQCKTGRLMDWVVQFRTRSIRSNTSETFTRPYIGEADVFLVYCPETDRIYAVPVEDAPSGGQMYLRVEPTVNRQAHGVNWAKQYELPG